MTTLMKARIYREVMDVPAPAPWRLLVPHGLKVLHQRIPWRMDFTTFDNAVLALSRILEFRRRGWLHR